MAKFKQQSLKGINDWSELIIKQNKNSWATRPSKIASLYNTIRNDWIIKQYKWNQNKQRARLNP